MTDREKKKEFGGGGGEKNSSTLGYVYLNKTYMCMQNGFFLLAFSI
jgi:hypothetical protein